MRSFVRFKWPLLVAILVILMAATLPLALSTVHSRSSHAATPAVTIPNMKLPWDSSLTTIPLTGGPSGNYPDKKGAILGKSGYAPCPNCKNGISVHLRLQFRQYTSNPLNNTPLSAQGMSIDGYRIWTFVNPSTGQGYQFQGTMTRGKTIIRYQSECGVNGVKTWYSLNGPTVLAISNGTGGYLTSTNTTSTNTDWPMFGFDVQQSRFNSSENILSPTNVSGLTLDWRYSTGGGSAVVVVNGVIYANSTNGKVYALNASTGAYLWSDPITADEESPAVANGVVYFGSSDGKLYALNATTGASLWSYSTGKYISSSPTVANGVVYFGSGDRSLYALNASTGSYLWSYSTGGLIEASPAVANGVVYFSSSDGKLYARNATTGSHLWSYSTGYFIQSSPAVANGVVYIGVGDGRLYALNASTGASLWSYSFGGGIQSSPAVANGVVYFSSTNNILYAFNATTGAYVWSYPTGDSIYSSPAVANGVVYFGSNDRRLYALNASTGSYLWSYTTGGGIYSSSPVVTNGVAYFGSSDGYLYAFHVPDTGA